MDQGGHRVGGKHSEDAVAGALQKAHGLPGLAEATAFAGAPDDITDLGMDAGQLGVTVAAEPFRVDDEQGLKGRHCRVSSGVWSSTRCTGFGSVTV
ncbi:hypothetical protein GCM10009780_31030 [Actinomadura alba]